MSSEERRNIRGNTDVGTSCNEPFQRAHARNAQHVRPSWRFYNGQAGMQHDARILVAETWLRMPASYHEGCVVSLHVRLALHCGAMGQSTLEQCTSVIASLASYTVEDDVCCVRLRMSSSVLRAAASATTMLTEPEWLTQRKSKRPIEGLAAIFCSSYILSDRSWWCIWIIQFRNAWNRLTNPF